MTLFSTSSTRRHYAIWAADWVTGLLHSMGHIPISGVDLPTTPVDHLSIPQTCFLGADLEKPHPEFAPVDVVMSLETMEHLAHTSESAFIDSLLAGEPRLVILSCAAGRGQYDVDQTTYTTRDGIRVPGGKLWKRAAGRRHINCQPNEVVIEKMRRRGYFVDEVLTSKFANLRSPRKRGNGTKHAFARFYRDNTRVYSRDTGR